MRPLGRRPAVLTPEPTYQAWLAQFESQSADDVARALLRIALVSPTTISSDSLADSLSTRGVANQVTA